MVLFYFLMPQEKRATKSKTKWGITTDSKHQCWYSFMAKRILTTSQKPVQPTSETKQDESQDKTKNALTKTRIGNGVATMEHSQNS